MKKVIPLKCLILTALALISLIVAAMALNAEASTGRDRYRTRGVAVGGSAIQFELSSREYVAYVDGAPFRFGFAADVLVDVINPESSLIVLYPLRPASVAPVVAAIFCALAALHIASYLAKFLEGRRMRSYIASRDA